MADEKNEPQSYGSQQEWVTGNTGEKVNPPKREPAAEHREFYDDRREAEESAPNQGGNVSDVQLAENAELAAATTDEGVAPKKVTTAETGAKREGYFKDRDYE